MRDKETISLLTDLIDEYKDKMDTIPENMWVTYYPTELHKERDNRWYAPTVEFKAIIATTLKQREEYESCGVTK